MPSRAPARTAIERNPPSILIVDDEPSIRDFLAFVLEYEGFRVSTAGNGQEALDLAKQAPPDVVLTDLMMPVVDGYALINGLREEQVPVRAIIAMSAVSVAGDRNPNADLFVSKPFDIDLMLACVQSLLAHS
ncbi:MAG: response regulator transcription factor [Dehalococcoidia bacterium]